MRPPRDENEPAHAGVPSAKAFTVEVRRGESASIVVPVGELDLANVDLVEESLQQLAGGGMTRIVLDLRRLSFIDSTGIRLVLRWQVRSREAGFVFELVQGPPEVERVFHVSGLLDRLPFIAPNEIDERLVGESS